MPNMPSNLFRPHSFAAQWHITERCNWRCKHCYQDSYTTPEMDLGMMENVLRQFTDLIKKWGLPRDKIKLALTGGEPFVRRDFFQFLETVHKFDSNFNWSILSNGSFLTPESVSRLKSLGIYNFQVSMEGLEKTNDEIRGKGSFQKILRAIKLLVEAGVPAIVSLTLSRENRPEIRELVNMLAPFGVDLLGVRRIVPFGSGASMRAFVLEPHELRLLYQEVEEINKKIIEGGYRLRVRGGCDGGIFNDEIFDSELMSSNFCGVADGRALTILPNGNVLACRRLPIKLGNLYEESLEKIYYSPLYEAWRNKEDVATECKSCPNVTNCFGGAKCVTYAMTGKTTPDVQCWKLFKDTVEAVDMITKMTNS